MPQKLLKPQTRNVKTSSDYEMILFDVKPLFTITPNIKTIGKTLQLICNIK